MARPNASDDQVSGTSSIEETHAPLTDKCRPEAILTALGDLEHAMANHTEWLKNWHVGVLSRMENTRNGVFIATDEPPESFSTWYAGTTADVFDTGILFDDIASKFKTMRERAQELSARVKREEIIPSEDYDRFMTTVMQFNALVRQLQNETWTKLANIDPLTGIGNRQAMTRVLDRERDRFLRSGNPCCVAIADLDRFKAINDNHGHLVGDRVIRAAAELFTCQLRPYDCVFRFGGEEFLFCFPDAHTAHALIVVERLRTGIEQLEHTVDGGKTVRATVSFGIAQMSRSETLEETIDHADRALLRAKSEGRNRACEWRND